MQINITIIIQTQVQIQSQIQITIQMENLLQAGRANPTHHAPAPPSLANTCRFSYMQGGSSQHASPRPPSLAHTCIFSYMQGGPVQHASPPLPLPPSLIRVYSLTCRVGQSNTPRPPSPPPSLANTCIFSYMQGGPSRKSREKVSGERLHQSTDESPTKVQRNLIRVTM